MLSKEPLPVTNESKSRGKYHTMMNQTCMQRRALSILLYRTIVAYFFLVLSGSANGAAPSAKDILIRADRARGGISSGAQWTLQLQSKEATYEYRVQVK